MNKKSQQNLMSVAYGQVEADPREIEVRLSVAFGVLFDEMEKKGRLANNNVKKEHEINTK